MVERTLEEFRLEPGVRPMSWNDQGAEVHIAQGGWFLEDGEGQRRVDIVRGRQCERASGRRPRRNGFKRRSWSRVNKCSPPCEGLKRCRGPRFTSYRAVNLSWSVLKSLGFRGAWGSEHRQRGRGKRTSQSKRLRRQSLDPRARSLSALS